MQAHINCEIWYIESVPGKLLIFLFSKYLFIVKRNNSNIFIPDNSQQYHNRMKDEISQGILKIWLMDLPHSSSSLLTELQQSMGLACPLNLHLTIIRMFDSPKCTLSAHF